ncbi:hypothetical protein CCC_03858 [Paramagnetospirillum magnetotacticum MS-1]|uniref:Uncharacterized protein n=1 Tax=Paramagnetospirillum magnetotacticum MS-1 TaxID=272627 RepID=A0A0C2V3P8_PARME|nr:hypothetical protein [Paramagnetospirillum magnetotacticum]KIL99686.1 hypothetical protein CCC_03858 [Paramagnetospirillum magnetotacticum MS-1]
MNAFHDFADMTRDYGLVRYFVMTVAVASFLMLILFLWGHIPDQPEAPAALPAVTAPQSTAPSSY